MKKDKRKFSLAILRVIKWGAIGVAGLLVLALIVVGAARLMTAQSHAVDPACGIDESIYVPLNGQEQYLLIRGNNVNNPVIIWLHGGPAGPDAYTNYAFQDQLLDEYTFVNWDQRGCGRTYFRNREDDPQNDTATFAQTQKDLDALIAYLCERFGQDKVILVGHSYGTAVGSRYALDHPERVTAYIGVGQLVTFESELYSYEDARQRALESGEDVSTMDAAYEQFLREKTVMNMLALRQQTSAYHHAEKANQNLLWLAAKSPYLGFDDVRWFLLQLESAEDFVAMNEKLFDYVLRADVRSYGLTYQMPVGFISGADDWTTPVKYTEDYFNAISAPAKEMQLIEGCGHHPQYEDSVQFSHALGTMLHTLLDE